MLFPSIVTSSRMLRAAAAPELFLDRGGFARVLSRGESRARASREARFGIAMPSTLTRFMAAVGITGAGSFRAHSPESRRLHAMADADLVALLSGAVPFGETPDGGRMVYLLGEPTTFGFVP